MTSNVLDHWLCKYLYFTNIVTTASDPKDKTGADCRLLVKTYI